jgi:hypothetical protein
MTDSEDVEDLVVIRTYLYRHMAELERSVLQANSVDAMITADDAGGVAGPQSPLTQRGVRLLVRQSDATKANEILK